MPHSFESEMAKHRGKKKAPSKAKMKKVMHEWKAGTLHSGSKKGPKVKSKKQALAIAYNS